MDNEFILIDKENEEIDDYINIINYNNIILDINKNKENYYYIFDYYSYFNDFINSLTNENIRKQFKVDYPRCKVLYNNEKYSMSNFIKIINNRYSEYINDILLLCTQGVLAEITILLSCYFEQYDLHFSEHNNKKKRKLRININSDNKDIHINIIKYMRCFKLDSNSNDITTHTIKINMNIKLYKNVIIDLSIFKRK